MSPRSAAATVLALLLASLGCDDGPVGPDPVTMLPLHFRLEGLARGTGSGELRAECALDLIFELQEVRRTPERVDYEGVHGGEAARAVLAQDDSGFSFVADVFGDVEARLFPTGRVEIDIPVNRDAEGRFWRNLARFEGTVDAAGRGEGTWTCAPLDIDQNGYRDTTVLAEGTWTFEPIS